MTEEQTEEVQEQEFFAETIAANTRRTQLILTANQDNQSIVWLGGKENEGTPLNPGENISLETTEVVKVSGKKGDWLHLSEIYQRRT